MLNIVTFSVRIFKMVGRKLYCHTARTHCDMDAEMIRFVILNTVVSNLLLCSCVCTSSQNTLIEPPDCWINTHWTNRSSFSQLCGFVPEILLSLTFVSTDSFWHFSRERWDGVALELPLCLGDVLVSQFFPCIVLVLSVGTLSCSCWYLRDNPHCVRLFRACLQEHWNPAGARSHMLFIDKLNAVNEDPVKSCCCGQIRGGKELQSFLYCVGDSGLKHVLNKNSSFSWWTTFSETVTVLELGVSRNFRYNCRYDTRISVITQKWLFFIPYFEKSKL